MDIAILLLICVVLITIIGVLTFIKQIKSTADDAPAPEKQQPTLSRRSQLLRNRNSKHQPQDTEITTNDDIKRTTASITAPDSSAKLGTKKKAKLEAKAERKAQREVEERLRAERRLKEQEEEELRHEQEEKERLEKAKRDEEERKAREEQARKEQEEYMQMKQAFLVEEEGFEDGNAENENENLLEKFVNFIKDNKVVLIDDLAAQFKLKTQAAIDRIRDLQNDNTLTGVIDDRGKFIYVSPEEMQAVAKFIKQRGRVSIAELAEHSNQLISLTPLHSRKVII